MALSSGIIWEIRETGSDVGDANGGGFNPERGGQDHSNQGLPSTIFTDLAIGATNSSAITSAAFPFVANRVGNVMRLEPGAGFTGGWYEIIAISGSIAIMDRSVGVAGSTSGSGRLGGAWGGSPNGLQPEMFQRGVPGNTFYIRQQSSTEGPFDSSFVFIVTGTIVPPSGDALRETKIIGYNSTRGDSGRPLIVPSGNVTTIVMALSGNHIAVTNLTVNASGRSDIGIHMAGLQDFIDTITVLNARQRGIYFSADYGAYGNSYIRRTYVSNCSGGVDNGAIVLETREGIAGCDLHAVVVSGNYTNGIRVNNSTPVHMMYCISSMNKTVNSSGGHGIYLTISPDENWRIGPMVYHSNFYGNEGDGIRIASPDGIELGFIHNCICACNSGYGIRSTGYNYTDENHADIWLRYNAYFSNSLGNRFGIVSGSTELNLASTPFVNPVGSLNFYLNNVSGGGLGLINTAASGSFAPLLPNTIRYPDIGAVQTDATAADDIGEG